MSKKQTVQQVANSIARRYGRGRATGVEVSLLLDDTVIAKDVRCGYRKNTTGEYVPSSYRHNFGWKNTYYQHAEFDVIIPLDMVKHCTDVDDYL